MSLISVIVPIFRVEKYIHRCIDSILAQTFRDFELILVDDGSPDNCPAICDEYAAKDPRVVVLHQKNGGLSSARNAGIDWALANSSCQYLTFVDSDDWITQYCLENLYSVIRKTGALISVGNHCFVESEKHGNMEASEVEARTMQPEEFKVQETRRFNYAWAKLYHISCFENIRYPSGKNFEDVFTTYRIIFKCRKIAVTDTVVYFYYKNPESITQASWGPTELVILDGVRQQMQFYKENGFAQAYEVEEKRLLWNYAYQIQRIRGTESSKKYKRSYVSKLRREMMYYIQKSNGRYNFSNVRECYEAAFPHAMKMYNRAVSLYHEIKEMR